MGEKTFLVDFSVFLLESTLFEVVLRLVFADFATEDDFLVTDFLEIVFFADLADVDFLALVAIA